MKHFLMFVAFLFVLNIIVILAWPAIRKMIIQNMTEGDTDDAL